MSQGPDSVDAMRKELAALRARIAELESTCASHSEEHLYRQLRQQLDELRLSFDSAPAMIWIKDKENRILRLNKYAAAASGRTVAEMEGVSTYDLFPAQAAAYHKDDLEVIRTDRPKLGIVEPIVTASGETRIIRTDKVPLHDEAGEVVGVVVFAIDVTDAERAKDALAESELRYRNLVETSHDLIWSVDAGGRWTFVNRAATLRIYGREPEELLGHHFTELQRPEDRQKDLATFQRILADVPAFQYETVHLHKNGTPIHLSFNAIVRRDADGNVIGTTGTASDITERRRAEEERELMNAKLLQTQKMESLGVLAGGIAHDFNNLLVGILGNTDLALMDMPAEAAGRHSLEAARDAARRAADLARQMLAYSGRGKFVVEALDLSLLVEEMGSLLSAVISKKAVLELEPNPGLRPVEGDATQLRQVIMNLITNASDALGDRDGVISVTSGVMHADEPYLTNSYVHDHPPAGEYVFVEVADNGCGMDERTMARMLEPFFTTKFTGRGLGLSAVLGIMRGHHGAIHVTSAVGRGTRFRILLPALPNPQAALAPKRVEALALERDWRGTGTILVVDDEPMVRAFSKRVLEGVGFQVLAAADGRAALEVLREHRERIVAVLLDMTMPHLSGKETFDELRRIDPQVRVVLTSGYSEQDAIERFQGRGLSGFLRKPCTPEEMVSGLRAAIER